MPSSNSSSLTTTRRVAALLLLVVLQQQASLSQAQQQDDQEPADDELVLVLELPGDYIDDIYHCDDPQRVYPFIDVDTTISCDPVTFLWRVEELVADVPPGMCAGITEVTPGEALLLQQQQIEDWFEPCVLWALEYHGTTPPTPPTPTTVVDEESSSTTTPNTPATPIPDDVYHCRDPTSEQIITLATIDSIGCDMTTYKWNLEELSPDQAPGMCGDPNFSIDWTEVPNVQDWFEPCVLWAMAYGNLATTATAPPTVAPSMAAAVVGIDEESSNVVVLEPIVLTLVWPSSSSSQLSTTLFSLDRFELRTLTERHVLEGLQAELGLALVTAVNLIWTTTTTTSSTTTTTTFPTSVTETLTGTVSLREASGIPSTTVQRLFRDSFEGTTLELYEFRLSISPDTTLQQVDRVIVGVPSSSSGMGIDFDGLNGNDGENDDDDDDDDEADTTLMIAIIGSVSAAIACVCCFGLCLLYHANQKAKFEAQVAARGGASASYKRNSSSIASSSRASRHSFRSGRYNSNSNSNTNTNDKMMNTIPGVPTKSMSADTNDGQQQHHQQQQQQQQYASYPHPIYEDDEENQMSIISMSEWGDENRSHDGAVVIMEGEGEDETESVYSYYNAGTTQTSGSTMPNATADNDSLLGGGGGGGAGAMSVADNSFMFSVTTDAVDDDDNDTLESYSNDAALYGTTHKKNKSIVNKQTEKKGFMWSVMDTMHKHFGDDDSSSAKNDDDKPVEDDDAALSKVKARPNTVVNILGRESTYDSDEDSGDAGTLFTDQGDDEEDATSHNIMASPNTSLNAVKTNTSSQGQEVEDYHSAEIGDSPQATTPVKERLERMWQEEDEEEARKQERMQEKPVQGIKLFSDNVNTSRDSGSNKTDYSPSAAAVLLDSANVRSAPPTNDYLAAAAAAPTTNMFEVLLESDSDKNATRIVNHIPDTYIKDGHDNQGDGEEDDDDDDDHKMTLQLPSQLKALDHPNSDNMSQSSSLSSRSVLSGLSAGTEGSGGLRNFYGAANIKAQSARNKRDSKWGSKSALAMDNASIASGSVGSVGSSTDSAKYRSLLNQGDTNDAALLLGLKEDKAKAKEDDHDGSKKDDASTSSASQLSSLILLSSFIQSAEGDTPDSNPSAVKPQAGLHFDDSDEEDIYVEGDDDEDDHNNEDARADESDDNASIKSGASRAVQELSSLLGFSTNQDPPKKEADRSRVEVIFAPSSAASSPTSSSNNDQETPTKTSDENTPVKNSTPSTVNASETSFSFDSVEKKLSFEVVELSDDESEEEKKYDYEDASPDWNGLNMERLRRLSLAGYADTMASF